MNKVFYNAPEIDEEAMVCGMEKEEIISDIRAVIAEVEETIFRHKHYGKAITPATLASIQEDLRFIIKRYS